MNESSLHTKRFRRIYTSLFLDTVELKMALRAFEKRAPGGRTRTSERAGEWESAGDRGGGGDRGEGERRRGGEGERGGRLG